MRHLLPEKRGSSANQYKNLLHKRQRKDLAWDNFTEAPLLSRLVIYTMGLFHLQLQFQSKMNSF